ncbi:hypothetical protein GCM10007079_25320 [Nocardiopsis terrae]|uniref:DUF6879 domain-containing protein n=1 Tax=Nocardiopsis terrae TaxID=372655 RepID=A0ABR9HFR8_9ACTN|nr:DUF6879 family protein [Nocardiopsis terrae]MBE1457863.1 hypothetical protein [Nocardiopsis terrae]GHC83855.1 hypothetical protein GCM10007079_25320 [Nocardiopsis terrae]
MPDFLRTFNDFHDQVFRLETLDFYDSASERAPLERFRAGLPQDPSWLDPWAERVRSIRHRGASIGRVHVVSEPLTEYAVFEMTCAYPSNADAGEEIAILPRPTAHELGVPDVDYWLFDDERTGTMVYDDTGTLSHVEVSTDPALVREHAHWRQVCRDHAVPLRRYLAQAGLQAQVGSGHHTQEADV